MKKKDPHSQIKAPLHHSGTREKLMCNSCLVNVTVHSARSSDQSIYVHTWFLYEPFRAKFTANVPTWYPPADHYNVVSVGCSHGGVRCVSLPVCRVRTQGAHSSAPLLKAPARHPPSRLRPPIVEPLRSALLTRGIIGLMDLQSHFFFLSYLYAHHLLFKEAWFLI